MKLNIVIHSVLAFVIALIPTVLIGQSDADDPGLHRGPVSLVAPEDEFEARVPLLTGVLESFKWFRR